MGRLVLVLVSWCFSNVGKLALFNVGKLALFKSCFFVENWHYLGNYHVVFEILAFFGSWHFAYGLYRGSYMSAHVLLNLLNELGKRDKMRGLPSILSLFRNEFNSNQPTSCCRAAATTRVGCCYD